jgi:hypothetical protein
VEEGAEVECPAFNFRRIQIPSQVLVTAFSSEWRMTGSDQRKSAKAWGRRRSVKAFMSRYRAGKCSLRKI